VFKWGYVGLYIYRVTWGYTGLHNATKGLYEAAKVGFTWLFNGTKEYMGLVRLHKVTLWLHETVHRVTYYGYIDLRGATLGY